MEDEGSRPTLPSVIGRLDGSGSVVVGGLGDSLTYGWMVRRGFFDRFVDDLARRCPRATVGRLNAGVPGDTALGGLRRVGGLLARGPDVVVVQFALNDAFAGIGPDRFASATEQIARAVIGSGAVPVLATSCPLLIESEQRLADEYYGRIRTVAAELDVPLADLERSWLAKTGPVAQRDDLFLADGVHPTDEGHQLMADGLLELFR